MRSSHRGGWRRSLPVLILALSGCALRPEGTRQETQLADAAGAPYKGSFEKREIPELPEPATWRDVLRRAFLVDGELEAAYHEWRAAIDLIDVASAYPNSNVELGFEYMFSSERMKSFDRTTLSAGFDGSMNLSFPTKVEQAGKVALAEARVAGERFRAKKFEVQRRVLFAWAEYHERAARISLMEQDLKLLDAVTQAAAAGARSGMSQEGLLRARVEAERLTNELADMKSEHEMHRATLNAMLQRNPRAALVPSMDIVEPREVPAEDGFLLEAAIDTFPEVSVMALELRGRKDALELARMKWIPDFSPMFSVTGTISQTIGAAIMLPTTIAEIRGSIRAAESEVRASEAMLRAKRADRMGEYVGLILTLRRAQARAAWIEKSLRPSADRIATLRRRAYETGAASMMDWLESRRTLIEVDTMLARTRAEIEKSIVDIECCLGRDIETMQPPVSQARVEMNHE